MKKTILLIAVSCATLFAAAEVSPVQAVSPAERAIAAAEKQAADRPKTSQPWNALALALARRARETSDNSYYDRANAALKKSFEISPGNFDAEKINVWLLLGRHEFAEALAAAEALNKKVPDDVQVYGFLVDANVELGKYEQAEKAAQWMLNLRPGNIPGLTRAAFLRELFGDVDGAIELMDMALQSTPLSETEDRAWILTQMAHLELSHGNLSSAETLVHSALETFPDYHYALARMAELRQVQKKFEQAATLLEQRYKAAPHAENLFDLAVALHRAGRRTEAGKRFKEFENAGIEESSSNDNANRELIFYYADYAHKPNEALKIATLETGRRQDVHTLDAYAWALFRAGRTAEADAVMKRVLTVGIRDARILTHAGAIAAQRNDVATARRYFRDASLLNSLGSDHARDYLSKLNLRRSAK
jgi:tetratricopeptide (TPR) repeat protein